MTLFMLQYVLFSKTTNCRQADEKAKTSPDEQLDGVRTGAQKMPDAEVWLFSLLIIGYWYLQICSTHTTPNKHNIPGSAHRHWTLSWWGSKKSSTSFLEKCKLLRWVGDTPKRSKKIHKGKLMYININ